MLTNTTTTKDLTLSEVDLICETLREIHHQFEEEAPTLQVIHLDGETFALLEDDTLYNLGITDDQKLSAEAEELATLEWDHFPIELVRIGDPDWYTEIIAEFVSATFEQ